MIIFSFRDVHPNQIDEHKIHREILSDGYSNYSHSLCVCTRACTCVGVTESVFAIWILFLVLDRKTITTTTNYVLVTLSYGNFKNTDLLSYNIAFNRSTGINSDFVSCVMFVDNCK